MNKNNAKEINSSAVRPPVVVVLGHVDHGKTSLLDVIRKTKVADKESGGITQHIGAYQTEVSGKLITFLDTPGHEAFTAIRSRGARVADIAILVVAIDEGVKPQTKEAIKIIKESGIPFIVAANKIDKEGTNIEKLKQELASEEVFVEDWGGKVPLVSISAKNNKNIDELLEMVLLVAEMEELKEDISAPIKGVIIESNLDKRTGHVATVLIQKGILKVGDWIVAGAVMGKVKMMEDFTGKAIRQGEPSQPVRILGWSSAPAIGVDVVSVDSKDEAEKLAEESAKATPLFQAFKGLNESGASKKTLNIVLKTDVSSSLEAVEMALSAIKSEEVGCRVTFYDIGNISDADVKMAIGSSAEIIGFKVSIDDSVRRMAENENVKIMIFDIIYELIEHIRKETEALLEPEVSRKDLGKMKILAIFKIDSKSQIVGGKVTTGSVKRGAFVDVLRNNAKILSGRMTQLQHNKEDVSEVQEGLQCGLKFEALPGQPSWDIKEGDVLEVYEEEKIQRSL